MKEEAKKTSTEKLFEDMQPKNFPFHISLFDKFGENSPFFKQLLLVNFVTRNKQQQKQQKHAKF